MARAYDTYGREEKCVWEFDWKTWREGTAFKTFAWVGG